MNISTTYTNSDERYLFHYCQECGITCLQTLRLSAAVIQAAVCGWQKQCCWWKE